ncbi:hypothetical protein SNEBB_002964 [Seison nebaliae]|nr:hypothetical protein SNEBB_002964 [Seison nebaliae]
MKLVSLINLFFLSSTLADSCVYDENVVTGILGCVNLPLSEIFSIYQGENVRICESVQKQLDCLHDRMDGCSYQQALDIPMTLMKKVIVDCCDHHISSGIKATCVFPSNSASACFSHKNLVYKENGQNVTMDQVKLNDKVLVWNYGKFEYSKVTNFLHRSPEETRVFYKLELANGKTMEVTGDHLMMVREKNSDVNTFLKMERVLRNEHNFVSISQFPAVESISIKNISLLSRTGVYAPLTESGTIVVNQLLTTCYASINSFKSAQFFTYLFRKFPSLSVSEKFFKKSEKLLRFILPTMFG